MLNMEGPNSNQHYKTIIRTPSRRYDEAITMKDKIHQIGYVF